MIILKEPRPEDVQIFLETMRASQKFHYPFIVPPLTAEEYQQYLQKSKQDSEQYYLAWQGNDLVGVFNISGITRGVFKSGYLGYFASVHFAGRGLMSEALKLVLKELFTTLDLHRIEANIQPTNSISIHLANKNGFLKEGFSPRYLKVHGIWQDHFRYALTLEDWLAIKT